MRAIFIAATGALLLAGCSSEVPKPVTAPTTNRSVAPAISSTALTQSAPTAPQQFTVAESAYNVIPQPGGTGKSYVTWVVVLRNPNSNVYGLFPVVTVTARDDSGAVLGTRDQTLQDLPPGTQIAFAGQIDATGQPTKVEFTPGKVQWQPTKTTAGDYKPFTVANLTMKPDPVYGYIVSGDIANPYSQDVDLAVTVLLRDDSGKLVGGYTDYVNGVAAGGSHPFSAEAGTTATPATRAEIKAMPWGTVTWNALVTGKK